LERKFGPNSCRNNDISQEGAAFHVTTALFLEYEAVLQRPEQQLATGMNSKDVEGFLAAFASATEPVELNFLWRPQLRDPAD
jgi:hypothetical protein